MLEHLFPCKTNYNSTWRATHHERGVKILFRNLEIRKVYMTVCAGTSLFLYSFNKPAEFGGVGERFLLLFEFNYILLSG